MEYKDYYKILGIDKKASPEEIKKQYRILARKYHPDVSKEPNAEEKFKEMREAYDVLKNPEKRSAYDKLGSNWQNGQGFTPPPNWGFQHSDGQEAEFDAGNFSEFFENLFSQRAHHARQGGGFDRRGVDQHSKVTISLQEAFAGTQRILELQEPDLDPETGQVALKTRSLKVKIPSGVTAGQQIRLLGQGGKGLGRGKKGDLYLEIQLAPHPFFTVKNRDIYLTLPVTPTEAALGAKLTVPTLAGNVELTIPPCSQTGTKLRLKGRGLSGAEPADQYVSLAVFVPEPKTPEQRELYQKLSEAIPYNPREALFNKDHGYV